MKLHLTFLLIISINNLISAQPVDKKMMGKGKEVFNTYCLPCHQEDGNGVPNLNPPLIKTPYVLGDKKRLIGIILNGFQDKVEINGEFYSNVMAPHDYLTDEEIASVLTYVRNSFGNKGTSVTLEEVKIARKSSKK